METKKTSHFDALLVLSEALKTGHKENLKVISADMGLEYQVLINKLNFSTDQLNFNQLLSYLFHPGGWPSNFFTGFGWFFNTTLVPFSGQEKEEKNEKGEIPVLTQVAVAVKEFGEVANTLHQAMIDHKITLAETNKLKKEGLEAIEAIALLVKLFEKMK